ncbi:MAG TPA: 2-dehydropantoate 2-reductase [Anaerolineales bacterium]|nr:2-dehydropantoate 2-reductase [Anaerolineales bacterium]
MANPPPPILIAGSGAMACLFGARLAPYASVTLLGTWVEGVAALQRDGIRLEAGGLETRHSVGVTSDPLDCRGARFALVLVKSWQSKRTAGMLAACLAPDGVALTLQNGLGNLEILQQALGAERSALGVTTTGATLLGPGFVRVGGTGPTHVAAQARLDPYLPLLRQAGFQVEVEEDVEPLLWGKLAVNAGINPLTALLRVTNGALLEDPNARSLMAEAARETAAVAAARGVGLPYANPAAQAEEVALRTGANRSSMLQDILRGAPTEIDAINGAVAAEGERLGVATPVNRTLWRLVHAAVAAGARVPA